MLFGAAELDGALRVGGEAPGRGLVHAHGALQDGERVGLLLKSRMHRAVAMGIAEVGGDVGPGLLQGELVVQAQAVVALAVEGIGPRGRRQSVEVLLAALVHGLFVACGSELGTEYLLHLVFLGIVGYLACHAARRQQRLRCRARAPVALLADVARLVHVVDVAQQGSAHPVGKA